MASQHILDKMPKEPSNNAADFLKAETGDRHFDGKTALLISTVLIAWACFQLWFSSPLPFILNFAAFNEDQAKYIHLAFAIFLAFFLFPASKKSSTHSASLLDVFLAISASSACLYLLIFHDDLASRMGAPTTIDLVISFVGITTLLEATRRTLGLPLVIVAIVFLTYTFAGQYMPEVISHKGASFSKVATHQWLSTEGIFGVALGVSTTFVFLFVLLGAFLDKAGAGNYLIKVSFSLLGHMRGGPAKAAVVASGFSGIISGSSIANVVTTGTFTIPLMKRVGFPGVKAGAIEVAASTNGQLTPPIMGAAAFLMVEYVGISYIEVIQHAILPSIISYIALVYIVHLEALKLNMEGIERLVKPTIYQRMLTWVSSFLVLILLGGGVYYGSKGLEQLLGGSAFFVMLAAIIGAYFWLVKLSAAYPDLEEDEDSITLDRLPETKPTIFAGLYFSLPIVVLLWALAVKQYSPQQSAFYAVIFLIAVVLTHKPIKAWFRREEHWTGQFKVGWDDFVNGMITSSRNMIGIGIATAAAGIIVGTVTLTGLGQMMTDFVEFISGGNLVLILIFTAIICIILGMGLPTTANYIVVSTLMAPVIVSLGAENGLVVPLIAVHLFVFYFGILADDTPPVGLAAFAAAAISGDDPIKTGIQGFIYDIRTAILPFMFIYNTQLLLIGIDSLMDLVLTIVSSIIAILVFAAGTQGYWLVKSRLWESLVLILIAFSLFRPGFWWDMVYEPRTQLPSSALIEEVEALHKGDFINLKVEGLTIEGNNVNKTIALQLVQDQGDGLARLKSFGLNLTQSDANWQVNYIDFGSPAEKAGVDFGWNIIGVEKITNRPPKELVFIPAILLLLIIRQLQRKRLTNPKLTSKL